MNWLRRLFRKPPLRVPDHWTPHPDTCYDKDGVIPERCEPIETYIMPVRAVPPSIVEQERKAKQG